MKKYSVFVITIYMCVAQYGLSQIPPYDASQVDSLKVVVKVVNSSHTYLRCDTSDKDFLREMHYSGIIQDLHFHGDTINVIINCRM